MMSMVRYPSSSLLRELQQDFFPFAIGYAQPQTTSQAVAWSPKVDIKETEEAFILDVDVPGVEAKDISVDMDDKVLSIKGERQIVREEKGENHYCTERVSGKFYRQFSLPETIESSQISAKVKNGVLTLHLPKAKESKIQRRICVEEA
jgi:HSP20 family protein